MARLTAVSTVRRIALTEASMLGAGGSLRMMPLTGPVSEEAPIINGVTLDFFDVLGIVRAARARAACRRHRGTRLSR